MKKLTTILFLLTTLAGISQNLNFKDVLILEADNYGTVTAIEFPQVNIEVKVIDSAIVFTEENFCGTQIDKEKYKILTYKLINKINFYIAERNGVIYHIQLPTKRRWMITISEQDGDSIRLISARKKRIKG